MRARLTGLTTAWTSLLGRGHRHQVAHPGDPLSRYHCDDQHRYPVWCVSFFFFLRWSLIKESCPAQRCMFSGTRTVWLANRNRTGANALALFEYGIAVLVIVVFISMCARHLFCAGSGCRLTSFVFCPQDHPCRSHQSASWRCVLVCQFFAKA